jgi:eukaryotic-like serine/threonine-protein kinase
VGATVIVQVDRLRAALADRYELDREIGSGGMAHVYHAYDRQHDRDVAIKVMRPELSAAIGVERFLREIRIEARLQHPNILPLYDSGSADGLLYYVMPYVEGESLRELIRREKQLPVPEAIRLAREVADALDYAHRHNVVHRDIKPGNILLSGGHPLVADFGLARAVSAADEESLTASGIAVGTAEYMSPEQASGESEVDGRSDIYALGCVLYETLAGDPPFSGRTVQSVLARHRHDPPPRLSVVRPGLPLGLEEAVEKSLAKVPADRFATARELADALRDAEQSRSRSRHLIPGGPRRRVWLRVSGVVTLVAFAIAAYLLGSHSRRNGMMVTTRAPWILVADFEGPRGDRMLATAVRELVTAELDQSRVIAPMPRQQVSEVMREAGLGDTASLTPALARELAVRSSVRTILSGSVLPVASGRYSIVVRVADADSGRTLATVTGAASDQDLIPTVENVARDIRQKLGEQESVLRSNKPLVRVATPSFAAYRKYVEAMTLSMGGQLAASNRLLQDAVALDTGFASAWGLIGLNHLSMRNLDSAGVALGQALRRPDRLSDAQRYRLEAESAYALRYDLIAAIKWYDLLLEVEPGSISGHNDRGIYLYSLGRYEEALAEFTLAATLEPFGLTQAQVELFNQTVTLLAMGRGAEAEVTSRKLTGVFAVYASQLIATSQGRWADAESLATRTAESPSTPPWLRLPATTMRSGALAARGAVAAAERQLRLAAGAVDGPPRRWYSHAFLLLVTASGHPAGPVPGWLLADTSAGGLLAGGQWAAMAGDTVAARARLTRLERSTSVELRRLGRGPRLLSASIEAAQGQWPEVIRLLKPAIGGELDGGDPDQVSSMAVRWILAEAYARTGRPDSAAAVLELVLDPSRTPYSHLALRGLVSSFASRRLALLYRGLHREEQAQRHWKEFERTFVSPDRDLVGLRTQSR